MIYLTYIPLVAALILSGFLLLALVRKQFIFWPPPSTTSWQNRVFITLFRIMVYGLIGMTIWHIWQFGIEVSSVYTWTAIFLIIIGFAGAFWATLGLGWKNAFGSNEGLITEGIFLYSRNPIYVATWFGLAGWTLLIPHTIVQLTLLCWAFIYIPGIFLEECWLRKEYGQAFEDYCSKVRRFF